MLGLTAGRSVMQMTINISKVGILFPLMAMMLGIRSIRLVHQNPALRFISLRTILKFLYGGMKITLMS